MVILNTFFALSLLTSVVSASYQNLTLPFVTPRDVYNFKRWFGVKQLPKAAGQPVNGGWGPWPIMCPGTQPLRYCFKDQRSANNLQVIVDQAVARWAHALSPATSLTISLDHDGTKVCTYPPNRDDTLAIEDATLDDDDDYNWAGCETFTTTGYNYGSQDRGRHTMKFCHLIPNAEWTGPKAVVAMMHELGHAMGLTHEHQRPDRGQYLSFKCANLEGYEKMTNDVIFDHEAKFDHDGGGTSPNAGILAARIRLCCTEALYARVYLPNNLQFLPGDRMSYGGTLDPEQDEKWQSYVSGTKFDFSSIMIYGSFTSTNNPNNNRGWVMWQKVNKQPVWMGGDKDPTKATISEGDVARVAQLYPLPDDGSANLQKANVWGPVNLRVKIRDDFEMVVGPPRAADEGSNGLRV